MSRTTTTVASSLQAYFLETSAEAAELARTAADSAAIAPWTGRRLRNALADLGPARPAPEATAAEIASTTSLPRPLPPPSRPVRMAPDTLPRAEQAAPLLAPEDIVRALSSLPAHEAPPVPAMPKPMLLDAFERPPMIIERAQAERELRAGAPMLAPARPNPAPALAVGFSLAVATGIALYIVLAGA